MFKRLFIGAALFVALSTPALAQNSNVGGASAARPQTPARTTPTPTQTPAPARTTRRGTA